MSVSELLLTHMILSESSESVVLRFSEKSQTLCVFVFQVQTTYRTLESRSTSLTTYSFHPSLPLSVLVLTQIYIWLKGIRLIRDILLKFVFHIKHLHLDRGSKVDKADVSLSRVFVALIVDLTPTLYHFKAGVSHVHGLLKLRESTIHLTVYLVDKFLL